MGFTKLDEGILLSSIMQEPPDVFKVWIALLAACKEDGIARVSSVGISGVCFLPVDTVKSAIKRLESPDEDSRSLNNEGRRIERVDGGFRIINYQKYREFTHKESEAKRKYQKYHSPEKSGEIQGLPEDSASASVSSSDSLSSSSEGMQGEINAAPIPEEKAPEEKTWRNDFDTYEKNVREGFKALYYDWTWILRMKDFHPGVNVRMTLERMFEQYWSLECGWKKKKSQKSKEIDWKRTIEATFRYSRVFIPKGQPDVEREEMEHLKREAEKNTS